jgi:mono/diheme cytochrome c family protein
MHNIVLVVLGACLLVLVGCGEGGESERGLRYMPDMYQSPALKSQEAFVVHQTDAEGNVTPLHVSAMQQPVDGTVPRGFLPYDLPITDTTTAWTMTNPVRPTADHLRLGRDKYDQFCAVCHGRDGNAENGYVATKFLGIPSLVSPVVSGYSDGHIQHIIARGRGRMPDYRGQMTAEERWAVVHYVRALNTAKALGVPVDPEAGRSFKPLAEPLPEYLRGLWPEELNQ